MIKNRPSEVIPQFKKKQKKKQKQNNLRLCKLTTQTSDISPTEEAKSIKTKKFSPKTEKSRRL